MIKHRNTIETWSRAGGEPINSGLTINYDFTTSANKAYGNNLIQVNASPLKFAIYSGDANQDGIIDASDLSLVENGASISAGGYISIDINGDDFVDAGDISIIENNIGISVISP